MEGVLTFRQPPSTTISRHKGSCCYWRSLPLPRLPLSEAPHTDSLTLTPLWTLSLTSVPSQQPPCSTAVTALPAPAPPARPIPLALCMGEKAPRQGDWMDSLGSSGHLACPCSFHHNDQQPGPAGSKPQCRQAGRSVNPTLPGLRLTSVAEGCSTQFTEFTLLCSVLEANGRRQSLCPQGAPAKHRIYTRSEPQSYKLSSGLGTSSISIT